MQATLSLSAYFYKTVSYVQFSNYTQNIEPNLHLFAFSMVTGKGWQSTPELHCSRSTVDILKNYLLFHVTKDEKRGQVGHLSPIPYNPRYQHLKIVIKSTDNLLSILRISLKNKNTRRLTP